MEFRILGPLYADAGTGAGPVVISQPLLQSALAVLLLRANRPCPRSMLIEALWAAEPPASPEASLRVCISRLRRSLGDCASRLDSVGPPGGRAPGHRQQRGYMMTVRPGELDVDEFTDLVAQGQAELDSGNAAAAAASFVQALALWGDPPLPDLPESEVIAAAVGRLRNQRQAAVDALIDARLAAGEPEQVLAQLRAAVSATPGRERTCAQLMRAYHALGMRTEALDVYQEARQMTLEQQGAEPGPVLAVLYQRILAEELTTDRPPQLTRAGAGGFALPGSQVPAPPPDFTGRSDEVARIVEYLTGPGVPVVVVSGGPGMGKSATVAVAALQLRRRFSAGQLYAELGGVERHRDPQEVLADILQSMGVPAHAVPPPGPARAAMYRSVLAGRKVLIIADDAASAAQVRPLIPAAGGAAVLVTSRGRLGGLAGARPVTLGELPADDALALLDLAAGPGRTAAAEQAAARKVVAGCAGMPLAIRLAGAVLAERPGLALTTLACACGSDRALDVFAAEDTSVRAAIGSSYRALPGPAQAALSWAAGAVPGEIPGWALTALAQDHGVADRLAAVGLLTAAPAEASGQRYRMHPLVRAYGRERADEHADRRREAEARLQAGWLQRADRAAASLPAVPFVARPSALPGGPPAEPDMETERVWLDSERAGLLAAVNQAAEARDARGAMALASRLMAHQCIIGAYADASRAWRTVVAAAALVGDPQCQATAEYYLAVALAESHEKVGEAGALLAGALAELERTAAADIAAADIAAMGYGLLARCASARRRHAAAIRAARQAIRLAGSRGDLARCCATAVLGLTFARVGIVQAGIQHCQQARSEAQRLGEPAYEAYATRTLAQSLIIGGHYAAAASACTDGIALAEGYGGDVAAARFMVLLDGAQGQPAPACAALVPGPVEADHRAVK
jgi:DNA-binding SARP family transcriptional activator